MAHPESAAFPLRHAWELIADLQVRREWIYWVDFLVSVSMGYAGASVYLAAPFGSWPGILGFVIGGFALFRVGSFIHEIIHFGRGEMVAFTVAWNLIAGIPMLMPSFLYKNHVDHHKRNRYGTHNDGEYLPLGASPLSKIVWFFAQALVMPAFIAFRFLVLTPLSFLHPRLRTWVLERASAYVINFHYHGSIPLHAPRKAWAALEWACFLRLVIMFAALAVGATHWTRIPMLYLFAVFVLGLNYIRNLVAHRYTNETGEEMSYEEQLTDSVNLDGVPILTELFFPLNLRYHATHHLFPTLPYHNLAAAHRRMMAAFPDSPYARTLSSGFVDAVRQLVTNSRRATGTKTIPQPHFAAQRSLRRHMRGPA